MNEFEQHLWFSLQGKGTLSNGNTQFHKSNNKYVFDTPSLHVPGTVLNATATAMSKGFWGKTSILGEGNIAGYII